jgi:hypothetical protein
VISFAILNLFFGDNVEPIWPQLPIPIVPNDGHPATYKELFGAAKVAQKPIHTTRKVFFYDFIPQKQFLS